MLRGKTAIVTGAARGIGKAIALKLAKEGANIVLNYRSTSPEDVIKEIESLGVKVLSIQGDVSLEEDANKLIEEAVKTFGSLDILVNNAGITRDGLIMRMKSKDFDDVININLKGAFNTTRAISSIMMKQRKGVIINISSVVGVAGNAGQSNYAASKAGLIGLTKSVAKELGGRGIRCNAVAPGFIVTDMTNVLGDKVRESIINGVPLKKLGETDDIAAAVAFLASDDAKYITGQVLNVDGGMLM
ncbi:3-oxoacyl-[acyl-carrier-protein] reductase [Clostridium fallax]|uniref:3-oxoacyl-[acyl-carrier-protein] reductase n=1 Tax=Clostridium fallax TaxID=1533 RepID=A0A1M4VTJ3_9CLOT|nr:3-oxoacyl-[acyl-carrier-protein] reductase [Clostridium fallax]SHE72170.1 3-oxoacyl-[acyl-carrier-protein] reductase [Clostridium fallax]SQB07680.1 3-oxoacyl-(acyl-carrier-protein) reductase [Clostridium fallax]